MGFIESNGPRFEFKLLLNDLRSSTKIISFKSIYNQDDDI